MAISTLVSKEKISFNPKKKEHLLYLKNFIKYNNWGALGCPFLLENPYTNVAEMCRDRALNHFLGKLKDASVYGNDVQE